MVTTTAMAELATPNLTLPTTTAMAEFISGGIDEEPLLIRRSYSYYDRFLDYDREEGVMPRRTGEGGRWISEGQLFIPPHPPGRDLQKICFVVIQNEPVKFLEVSRSASGPPGIPVGHSE